MGHPSSPRSGRGTTLQNACTCGIICGSVEVFGHQCTSDGGAGASLLPRNCPCQCERGDEHRRHRPCTSDWPCRQEDDGAGTSWLDSWQDVQGTGGCTRV